MGVVAQTGKMRWYYPWYGNALTSLSTLLYNSSIQVGNYANVANFFYQKKSVVCFG
jgi:hypothetical protein